MVAKPPLLPFTKLVLSTVTRLAEATFFELKLAVPVAVTVSVPTNPADWMLNVGEALVVPS